MANARGKEVDTTFLSLTHATERGFIHRDYLAHCLRWSHVIKYLHQGGKYKTAHVLDVGCGRELPLAKALFSMRMTHTTGSYTGVDYGPIPWPESISDKTTKWNMRLYEKTDFVKSGEGEYDVITCFEMLEHVEPWHSYQTLVKIRECLAENGVAFISTPCYDQKTGAADNHVNEMSYAGLKAMLACVGLEVEAVYGTFASQKDYKKLMTPAELDLFDRLSAYYESNLISVIFAPLFPEQSRNCLWRLKAAIQEPTPLPLGPAHSNSDRWDDDAKRILADSKKRAKANGVR